MLPRFAEDFLIIWIPAPRLRVWQVLRGNDGLMDLE